MSVGILIALFVGTLVFVLGLAYAFGLFSSGRRNNHLKSIVSLQRKGLNTEPESRDGLLGKSGSLTGKNVERVRRADSRLTLTKRLKYAQWSIPPVAFHACELGISVVCFALIQIKMHMIIAVMSLVCGPLFMRWLLNLMMENRFKRFDNDYPQFLLSLVGLLKTGMTPIGALESAADGLEQGSLVKEEVQSMIERLRLGVSEDKSIGVFGEDIYHPEIELFVQALLLSRRVGGTLSDTLERLAKQVRKRQYFRSAAVSAVSLQRGSIWMLMGMLAAIELYLYRTYPEMVTEGLHSEGGWVAWQVGIVVILLGIFWVRQVTKIRI